MGCPTHPHPTPPHPTPPQRGRSRQSLEKEQRGHHDTTRARNLVLKCLVVAMVMMMVVVLSLTIVGLMAMDDE